MKDKKTGSLDVSRLPVIFDRKITHITL